MIQKVPDIVLEVPNDAGVSKESVLDMLILNVTHTVIFHPLQLGLAPPAQEVMDTTMVIIPIVCQIRNQIQYYHL